MLRKENGEKEGSRPCDWNYTPSRGRTLPEVTP